MQHTEAELAVALDGHDARMRQLVRGVAFELDAFLEIHEVKFHLIRAAPERQVRDEHVKQCGFARTGFAGDQTVLARALAEREVLQLRRASPPDGDAQFARCLQTPYFPVFRRNLDERHLDAIGVGAFLADLLEQFCFEFRRGRRVEREFRSVPICAGQRETFALGHDADGVLPQFVRHKFHRRRLALIPMNQQMNSAARATGGDTLETLHRHVAEVGGEIRDDQKMIFLGESSGLGVVFRERLVFVAQIHLRDFLNVLVEVREALLELRLLRPDAAVDEALLEIREVHDAGEILAEANRIEDREREPARRRGGEQAQHEIVQRANDLGFTGLFCFDENRSLVRHGQQQRQGKLRWAGECPRLFLKRDLAKFLQVHRQLGESGGLGGLIWQRECLPQLVTPGRESSVRCRTRRLQRLIKR